MLNVAKSRNLPDAPEPLLHGKVISVQCNAAQSWIAHSQTIRFRTEPWQIGGERQIASQSSATNKEREPFCKTKGRYNIAFHTSRICGW